ncbi:MAG TPA: glycosyltransferase [Candidatus Glassbacteria bacterium]|nr:glycosyltransferase [Candidatus Glassbacteria bacterium]
MRNNPEVSYLMPAYNAATTIARALNSLLGQRNSPELEVVVVDDGSTDGTREVVDRIAGRDPRVRLLATAHRGQVAAAMTAQDECRGSILARLDADDVAHPDRTRRQADLLDSDPRLGAVGSRVRYFPRRRIRAGLLRYESWLNGLIERDPERTSANLLRELLVECPLANPALAFRREAFEAVGGYREFEGLPEDYDLVFRLVSAGWKIGGVPEVLHLWRDHPGRASRCDPRYSEENFRRLKLHYLLALRLDGGRRPVTICGAGPVGKAWLRSLQKAGVEVRCLVEVNPRKIGKTIHGVPVVSAGRLGEIEGGPGLILGAVGKKGGRDSLRGHLEPLGLVEGNDYIFVA